MKLIINLLGVLVLTSFNTTDAAILRLESVIASANLSLDGMVESDGGNTLVEISDPNSSTFALADPSKGEIKVQATASEVGRMRASAVGSIRLTFRADEGAIFFPEGAFQANFDSTMVRNAVAGINTIDGSAQTVSQQQASLFGGTRGSGLAALIDVTDFVLLPFPRIIEPNPVTPNSGASVDWSADHLISSLSSQPFELEENRALMFNLTFRVVANISEKGFAESNGSNTASFSLVLPEGVTLLDVPENYSWITVAPVPLPGAYLFLMTGLGAISLISKYRPKTPT